MSTQFTPNENVVFSLVTKRGEVPTDVPANSPMVVKTLFVVRDGVPINLADSGVTFSKLSNDPSDAGQYYATVDRTALVTEGGAPFEQQVGDIFGFTYEVDLLGGTRVSENKFASIVADHSEQLDRIESVLSSIDIGGQITVETLEQPLAQEVCVNDLNGIPVPCVCVSITSDEAGQVLLAEGKTCLLYTSPSPRDQRGSRMPSSA